jgi:hypothetical protein
MRLVEHRKCHLGCSTFFIRYGRALLCPLSVTTGVNFTIFSGSFCASLLILLAYDIYKKRKRWVDFQAVFSSKVGRCFVGETEWREQ